METIKLETNTKKFDNYQFDNFTTYNIIKDLKLINKIFKSPKFNIDCKNFFDIFNDIPFKIISIDYTNITIDKNGVINNLKIIYDINNNNVNCIFKLLFYTISNDPKSHYKKVMEFSFDKNTYLINHINNKRSEFINKFNTFKYKKINDSNNILEGIDNSIISTLSQLYNGFDNFFKILNLEKLNFEQKSMLITYILDEYSSDTEYIENYKYREFIDNNSDFVDLILKNDLN